MAQFAITRNEYHPEAWTSRCVRIVEDLNEAYRERDRIEVEISLPGGRVAYGVRRLPAYIDTSLPGYLDAANRLLWPHLYKEGVA